MRSAAVLPLVLLAAALVLVAGGDAGPRPGLCIGTSHSAAADCDIVKNGTVDDEWDKGGWYDFEAGEIGFSLYYSLNKDQLAGSALTQDFSMIPMVLPMGSMTVVFPPPGGDKGSVTVGRFTEATHIEMLCNTNGTSRATLEIKVEPYQQLDIYFNKTCIPTNINVGVPYERGLSNVVNMGRVNIGFSYKAGVEEDRTKFGIWVDNNGGILRQHFMATLGYDQRYLAPADNISPSPAIATRVSAGTVASMEIVYNCLPTATNIETRLNMSINVGWRDPIQFSWTKVCGPKAKPTDPGWSAAAIFFFVLFIITLVMCTAGCGFNYVKKGRTGWDMIPGIDLYRQCAHSICPSRKPYTPQSHYDEEADTTAPAAAAYQSDL